MFSKAPKISDTDGFKQHPVVIRYFHPSGTESLVCEVGEDGEAFGYQVLNGDWENGEFGYLDLYEILRTPRMEVDYHFPENMSIERWLYHQEPEHFKEYAGLRELPWEAAPVEEEDRDNGDAGAAQAPLPAEEQIRVLNGRRTEMFRDGTTVFSWPDGRVIKRDARRNVIYDSAFENQVVSNQPAGKSSDSGSHPIAVASAQEPAREDEEARRHKITRGEAIKARKRANEILKKADKDITRDELRELRLYEGAGGLHEGGQTADGVLNEFYTPRFLVEKVAELANHYRPGIKTALEPSAGPGRFADAFSGDVKFTMYERDAVSARINRLLHPGADVRNMEFQAQFFDAGGMVRNKKYVLPKYDLVVGNPPYGEYADIFKGRGEGREFARYEEYFVSRGIDSLSDDGILAMVLPSSFLNSPDDGAKKIVADKCEIVDAYRLPEGVFPSTDVGTDIVLLKRGHCEAKDISNGSWFVHHPEKIMGVIRERRDRYGKNELYVACRGNELPYDAVMSISVPGGKEKSVSADARPAEPEVSADVSVMDVPFPEPGSGAGDVSADKDRQAKLAAQRKLREYEDKDGLFNTERKLSSSEFAGFYSDGSIAPEEHDLMIATGADGNIDLGKVVPERLDAVRAYLEGEDGREKYVRTGTKDGNPVYQHVAWFASGNIYEKLDFAEDAHEAGNLPDDDYARCCAVLKGVLPEPKKAGEIELSPISPLAYELRVDVTEFSQADDVDLHNGVADKDGFVSHTQKMRLNEAFLYWATGEGSRENLLAGRPNGLSWISDWTVANIRRDDIPPQLAWVDVKNFIQKVPVDATAVKGHSPDKEEERRQAQQAKHMKEDSRRLVAEMLFSRFLREGLSSKDRAYVEDQWNRTFNACVNADYSKLPFFVDGMSTQKDGKPFRLFRQQTRGISFLTHKGCGLLAYEVGLGKTSCGIVATVSNMQAGRCKRPIIIVPLGVYDNWLKTFKAHFPDVPVFGLGNMRLNYKDFASHYDAENHRLDIPEGTVSIATYEALDNIVFLPESWNNEAAKAAGLSEAPLYEEFSRIISGDDASSRKKMENLLGVATKAENASYVFWETSGFDHITVDEAHNFRSLYGRPSANESKVTDMKVLGRNGKRIANEIDGISDKEPMAGAIKLFAATQLVQRGTERNVFLLTATPFINNPVEIYSMLSYIARPALKERGVDRLYDFCVEFADCRSEWSVRPNGSVDMKRVIKNFKSVGALHSLVAEYIDKVSAEEAGIARPVKLEVPSDSSSVPRELAEYEMTDLQKAVVEHEKIRMMGTSRSNPAGTVVAMTNMRKCLVSPVLCHSGEYPEIKDFPGPDEFVTSSPKLRLVCDSVARTWKAMPERGQLLYVPLGKEYFSKIVDYLEGLGVPRSAVGMIAGGEAPKKRVQVKDSFNDPKNPLKIIIGTSAMSEGLDLNGNTVSLYIVGLDWNPSDRVQVVGRLWRQGNRQENVFVVTPYARNSIDSVLLQKYDEKSSRIDSIFDYKEGQAMDVSEISPEELKFDLITDPEVKADFLIRREVSKIENELLSFSDRIKVLSEYLENRGRKLQDIFDAENRIQRNQQAVEEAKAEIARLDAEGVDKDDYRYDSEEDFIKYRREEIKDDKVLVKRRDQAVISIDRKINFEFDVVMSGGRVMERREDDGLDLSIPVPDAEKNADLVGLSSKALENVLGAGLVESDRALVIGKFKELFDKAAGCRKRIEEARGRRDIEVARFRKELEEQERKSSVGNVEERAVTLSNYIISHAVYKDVTRDLPAAVRAEAKEAFANAVEDNDVAVVLEGQDQDVKFVVSEPVADKEVVSLSGPDVVSVPVDGEAPVDEYGQLGLFGGPAVAVPAVKNQPGGEFTFENFTEAVYGCTTLESSEFAKKYGKFSVERQYRIRNGFSAYRLLQKVFEAGYAGEVSEDGSVDEDRWNEICEDVLRPIYEFTGTYTRGYHFYEEEFVEKLSGGRATVLDGYFVDRYAFQQFVYSHDVGFGMEANRSVPSYEWMYDNLLSDSQKALTVSAFGEIGKIRSDFEKRFPGGFVDREDYRKACDDVIDRGFKEFCVVSKRGFARYLGLEAAKKAFPYVPEEVLTSGVSVGPAGGKLDVGDTLFSAAASVSQDDVSQDAGLTDEELTDEECNYVRSDEFKKKFGDWEKAFRLDKLRRSAVLKRDGKVVLDGEDVTDDVVNLRGEKDNKVLRVFAKDIGRAIKGVYRNDDTGIDISVSMANIDEIKNHHMAMAGHLEAIQYIPDIIKAGIFIAEEPNADRDKHQNIESYRYFVTGLSIGGVDYTCKSVVGVDKEGNCYYDQRLSQIEKGLLLDNLSLLMSGGKSLQSLLNYDTRLVRICQCPQAVYLDENFWPTKDAVRAVRDGKLYVEVTHDGFEILHDDVKGIVLGKELSELFAGKAEDRPVSQDVSGGSAGAGHDAGDVSSSAAAPVSQDAGSPAGDSVSAVPKPDGEPVNSLKRPDLLPELSKLWSNGRIAASSQQLREILDYAWDLDGVKKAARTGFVAGENGVEGLCVAWESAWYHLGYWENKDVFLKDEPYSSASDRYKYSVWDFDRFNKKGLEPGSLDWQDKEIFKGKRDACKVFHDYVVSCRSAKRKPDLAGLARSFSLFEARLGMTGKEIKDAASVVYPKKQYVDANIGKIVDWLGSDAVYDLDPENFAKAAGSLLRISSSAWKYYNADELSKSHGGGSVVLNYVFPDSKVALCVVHADGNVGNRKKGVAYFSKGLSASGLEDGSHSDSMEILSSVLAANPGVFLDDHVPFEAGIADLEEMSSWRSVFGIRDKARGKSGKEAAAPGEKSREVPAGQDKLWQPERNEGLSSHNETGREKDASREYSVGSYEGFRNVVLGLEDFPGYSFRDSVGVYDGLTKEGQECVRRAQLAVIGVQGMLKEHVKDEAVDTALEPLFREFQSLGKEKEVPAGKDSSHNKTTGQSAPEESSVVQDKPAEGVSAALGKSAGAVSEVDGFDGLVKYERMKTSPAVAGGMVIHDGQAPVVAVYAQDATKFGFKQADMFIKNGYKVVDVCKGWAALMDSKGEFSLAGFDPRFGRARGMSLKFHKNLADVMKFAEHELGVISGNKNHGVVFAQDASKYGIGDKDYFVKRGLLVVGEYAGLPVLKNGDRYFVGKFVQNGPLVSLETTLECMTVSAAEMEARKKFFAQSLSGEKDVEEQLRIRLDDVKGEGAWIMDNSDGSRAFAEKLAELGKEQSALNEELKKIVEKKRMQKQKEAENSARADDVKPAIPVKGPVTEGKKDVPSVTIKVGQSVRAVVKETYSEYAKRFPQNAMKYGFDKPGYFSELGYLVVDEYRGYAVLWSEKAREFAFAGKNPETGKPGWLHGFKAHPCTISYVESAFDRQFPDPVMKPYDRAFFSDKDKERVFGCVLSKLREADLSGICQFESRADSFVRKREGGGMPLCCALHVKSGGEYLGRLFYEFGNVLEPENGHFVSIETGKARFALTDDLSGLKEAVYKARGIEPVRFLRDQKMTGEMVSRLHTTWIMQNEANNGSRRSGADISNDFVSLQIRAGDTVGEAVDKIMKFQTKGQPAVNMGKAWKDAEVYFTVGEFTGCSVESDGDYRARRDKELAAKQEMPAERKPDASVVSGEKKPRAHEGASEVSSAAVPAREKAEPLTKDLGTPLLDKKFRMNFRENADRLLRTLYGRKCPGIHVGEEVPGGACRVLFEKDGGEVEAGGFYVLHKSDVWEIRKRTPYVDSLLRGDRDVPAVSCSIGEN